MGKESQESKHALFSTIHGAGRAMGRTQAKGKTCRKTGRQLTEGLISKESHQSYMLQQAPEVRGGGLDESTLAYKRIEQVLGSHKATVNVLHTLRPIGVAMAPEKEYDPYKD